MHVRLSHCTLCIAFIMMTALTAPRRLAATEELTDRSLSPIRGMIERFQQDRSAQLRVFTISISPNRESCVRTLIDEYLAKLKTVSFKTLDRDGKIDFLLFRNELRFLRAELSNARKRYDEISELMPFATSVIRLEEGRRQLADQSGRESAQLLTSVSDSIETVKKNLAATQEGDSLSRPDAVRANRAAKIVYELRRALDSWFRFYDSYDPEFTWWVKQPVEAARKELDDYAQFLKGEFAGYGGADAPIIGDPIGRTALLDALRKELIPIRQKSSFELQKRNSPGVKKK